MSQPLCPHGNYDTTCPLCENVWDEQSPLAPREAPWHEREGVVPEAPPHTTIKDDEVEPEPAYCGDCGYEFDDGKDECLNLVCGGKFKKNPKKAPVTPGGYGDYDKLPIPEADVAPKRMGSPFTFGQAVLEPIVQPLYDTLTIPGSAPNMYLRAFTDNFGKRDNEAHPRVQGGGSLPAPNIFVCSGLRVKLWPTARYATPAEEQMDRDDLERNMMLRFMVGVRYYFEGPHALLPHRMDARRVCIPPQQAFNVAVEISGAQNLYCDWKVLVVLDGELGMEVN